MRGVSTFLAAGALVASCAGTLAPPKDPFPALPRSEIQIVTASGTHRFDVWIAADERSRQRGLMFVRELPPDRGMLFLFDRPEPASFWMKDTYLSLDLVFIDPTGVVVNIAPAAKPFSLDPIPSQGPVIAVLEVIAGTAARINLAPGDQVNLAGLRRIRSPSGASGTN